MLSRFSSQISKLKIRPRGAAKSFILNLAGSVRRSRRVASRRLFMHKPKIKFRPRGRPKFEFLFLQGRFVPVAVASRRLFLQKSKIKIRPRLRPNFEFLILQGRSVGLW